jgi:hypothetical protein
VIALKRGRVVFDGSALTLSEEVVRDLYYDDMSEVDHLEDEQVVVMRPILKPKKSAVTKLKPISDFVPGIVSPHGATTWYEYLLGKVRASARVAAVTANGALASTAVPLNGAPLFGTASALENFIGMAPATPAATAVPMAVRRETFFSSKRCHRL